MIVTVFSRKWLIHGVEVWKWLVMTKRQKNDKVGRSGKILGADGLPSGLSVHGCPTSPTSIYSLPYPCILSKLKMILFIAPLLRLKVIRLLRFYLTTKLTEALSRLRILLLDLDVNHAKATPMRPLDRSILFSPSFQTINVLKPLLNFPTLSSSTFPSTSTCLEPKDYQHLQVLGHYSQISNLTTILSPYSVQPLDALVPYAKHCPELKSLGLSVNPRRLISSIQPHFFPKSRKVRHGCLQRHQNRPCCIITEWYSTFDMQDSFYRTMLGCLKRSELSYSWWSSRHRFCGMMGYIVVLGIQQKLYNYLVSRAYNTHNIIYHEGVGTLFFLSEIVCS